MIEMLDEVNECFDNVKSLYNDGNHVVQAVVVGKCFDLLKCALPESDARELLIKVEECIVR